MNDKTALFRIDKRVLKRVGTMAGLILVAPFVPLIRIPWAIYSWWLDICDLYSEWLEAWRDA